MSDWNESACWGCLAWLNTKRHKDSTHLSGNDERNRLDAGPVNLVSPCDLTLCNVESAAGEETHPALWV
jgi:hypothetical protein